MSFSSSTFETEDDGTLNSALTARAARIPLNLTGPPVSALQPMTIGVPLPKGARQSAAGASLISERGREIPCQAEPLARWSDGSIQWLLLDAMVSGEDLGSAFLTWNASVDNPPSASEGEDLQVDELQNSFIARTGIARFSIDRRHLAPMMRVWTAGAGEKAFAELEMALIDRRGRRCAARIERACIETRGIVRTTYLTEGSFPTCRGIKFRARICVFRGTGLVRVRFTLHNSNRARHRGGLWDLGDRGSFLFRSLSLELRAPQSDASAISWSAEPGLPTSMLRGEELQIYQDSSGGENWRSRNHLNRSGAIPCQFRGYRVRSPRGESTGCRANPVVAGGESGLYWAVAAPEFWQQFPKSMEWRDGRLSIGLFPSQWADLHELQGGEQKTHTVWLSFGEDHLTSTAALSWVHEPVRPQLVPEWVKRSEAIPHFVPAADDCDPRLHAYLADAARGPKSLIARREIIDEFGWRNYGDIYADHETTYYHGPAPLISHYNNQFDVVYGALLQWLRTSDEAWRDIFAPLARHIADIDIYRTREDRAAYNGGLFWFTDHYLDAATSTHRTYSACNRNASGAYGGGPGAEHNFTRGLLHAYYLTGDRDYRDAVLELADWVIAMDDGAKNIIGLIVDEPTGLATVCSAPHGAGPARGGANSVAALLDAWRLSGDITYLQKAEALIKRCIHPADDVAARDLLNIEKSWSYTMFLVSLADYLALKREAGQLDAMYAYARSSLLNYAAWMLHHERPYFDQAEQMQYPTEAWAAQEFRKANVMRLGACHAEGELREKLLARAASLADRAWTDLMRFESRLTARAIAIVLIEGVRDLFFRRGEAPRMPEAEIEVVFGSPPVFSSQRQRALNRIKTLRGLAGVARRLLSPDCWRRTLLRY